MPKKLSHCFEKWSPTKDHKKYRLNPRILIFKIVEVLSCKEFTTYASQPIQPESWWIWCSYLSLKFWKSHLLNQDISRTKNFCKTVCPFRFELISGMCLCYIFLLHAAAAFLNPLFCVLFNFLSCTWFRICIRPKTSYPPFLRFIKSR